MTQEQFQQHVIDELRHLNEKVDNAQKDLDEHRKSEKKLLESIITLKTHFHWIKVIGGIIAGLLVKLAFFT